MYRGSSLYFINSRTGDHLILYINTGIVHPHNVRGREWTQNPWHCGYGDCGALMCTINTRSFFGILSMRTNVFYQSHGPGVTLYNLSIRGTEVVNISNRRVGGHPNGGHLMCSLNTGTGSHYICYSYLN